MNKKFKGIIFGTAVLIISALLLSACSGKNKNNASDTDTLTQSEAYSESDTASNATDTSAKGTNESEAELLKAYFDDELLKKYGKTAEISSDNDSSAKGLTGAYICDIDADGIDEMLVTRSVGLKNTQPAVEIFEAENGTVKTACTVFDGKKTYSNAYANSEVFLKKHSKGYYICLRLYTTSEMSGLPSSQSFGVYEYKNGKSEQVCELEYNEKTSLCTEVIINGEIMYKTNEYGNPDSAYKLLTLQESVNTLSNELKKYGLEKKLYCEKSGNEIIAVTFEDSNEKDGEIPLCYRREVSLGNNKGNEIRFDNKFFEKGN